MIQPPPIVPSTIRCVQCGYDLTGTTIGGTCPECGTTVEESLKPRHIERTSGYATAALVLGILSLAACALLGPVAIAFSLGARRQISNGGFSKGSSSLATAGLVLGIIGTALLLLWTAVMTLPLLVR